MTFDKGATGAAKSGDERARASRKRGKLVPPAAGAGNLMTLTLTLAAAEVVWIVVISGWVLLEKRAPVATLAWIFGLALLPIVGGLIYFLWGPRRFDRKKLVIRRARGAVSLAARLRSRLGELGQAGALQLAHLASSVGRLPPMTATRFAFYTEGDPFYDALARAIANARHHVHLEYYIFKDDAAARPLIELLAERAAAGVEVRIIADALGSRLPAEFVERLRAKGIQFAFFNPTMIARLGRRIINFRTHRKIAVIDGVAGFTGGTNIWADHSVCIVGERARRDTDIEIHGEAVHGLQHAFLEDWLFASDEAFGAEALAGYFPAAPAGAQIMQIIPSGPDTDEHAIYAFMLAAIGLARKRVWLTTPYFVPDEALLGALCIAARRGIDVQLIVPGKSDWRWVDAAGASNHDDLLRAGVKIFLNGPPLLHAKTAVIDDEIGVISTANLDERSLKLNFEIAAVLYGGPGIEGLATIFAGNRAASFRKDYIEAEGPLGRRLFQAVARLLSPQL